ncbi:MAG TPA: hypothetical protein VL049_21360 [Candidatus Dormibacteraeota bacterium]|nr:hypothetical protein [Candidatus Dormibacteraeota bacterium]
MLPSVAEQEKLLNQIDADCEQAGAAINHARNEISLLLEYRTRLIADVVTGKLDVRAAARGLADEVGESESIDDSGALDEDDEHAVGDASADAEEFEA